MSNIYLITGEPRLAGQEGGVHFDRFDLVSVDNMEPDEEGDISATRISDKLVQFMDPKSLFKLPTKDEASVRLDFELLDGSIGTVLVTGFKTLEQLADLLSAAGHPTTLIDILGSGK
ncbi:hypothetical protein ACWF99_23810 [Nocardia sp. NPDC055002]